MERYYICGEVSNADYKESFERIIDAKNEKEARVKLLKQFNDFERCEIEQIYKTSWDAVV